MKITIKCKAADELPLEQLTGLQGELKTLSGANRDKLKASILKYGFSAPIFIWKNGKKNYLLDGHQRVATLEWMQEDGYEIPPLPVAYVVASSVKEAREKLLHISSQYGEFDTTELNEWVQTIGDDIAENLRLCNAELDMLIEEQDYTEFEKEYSEMEGEDEVSITFYVPSQYRDKCVEFLSNGRGTTGAQIGRGVLELCGLL